MSALWDGVREGCGSCYFGLTHEQGAVQCRRHPPVLLVVPYSGHNEVSVETHQPWMAKDDWCGEYKRKERACPES